MRINTTFLACAECGIFMNWDSFWDSWLIFGGKNILMGIENYN